jgi:hypothetical protein
MQMFPDVGMVGNNGDGDAGCFTSTEHNMV